MRRGPAAGLLVMCLSVVAVLAAAHLGHTVVGRPGDPGFNLGQERGFGEVFFMIMTIWTTALLVLLAARTRSLLLAGWAVAFTYLFVDDWFTVHERAVRCSAGGSASRRTWASSCGWPASRRPSASSCWFSTCARVASHGPSPRSSWRSQRLSSRAA